MRILSSAVMFILTLMVSGVIFAATPTLVNYQGFLADSAGTPVSNGSHSIVFSIYSVPTAGSALWTETHSVITSSGNFAVLLGSITPIIDNLFSDTSRYLGIKVGADPEISPRTRLVTVPYAYRVATVDGSRGGSISGNINLDSTTATTGIIFRNGTPFLHDFGTDNLFAGRNAGNLSMTGDTNVAIGVNTLSENTTGSRNTAVGFGALYSNQASYNTAVGQAALATNVSGTSNTAIGRRALPLNVDGSDNVAIGTDALFNNIGGSQNAAVGANALYFNQSGSQNTAFGKDALSGNVSGSNNTALGYNATVSSGAFTNSTVIGANATVNASNKIRLGNSSVTVIEGQVAYTFTSDKNQKENFQPLDGNEVLEKIASLDVSSWNYIGQDPNQFRHYGPVAQEFFAAFGHDGVGTAGTPTTINSGDMAGIMLKAIQALEKENSRMRSENAAVTSKLETTVERLQQEIAALKTMLDQSR